MHSSDIAKCSEVRQARRCCGRGRVSCVRSGALDHGSEYPGRWWVESTWQKGISMERKTEENNKELVLEPFDALFNRRDYVAAERYWSPHYIQHSAHIEPGREGLLNLIKSLLPRLKYEPEAILPGERSWSSMFVSLAVVQP